MNRYVVRHALRQARRSLLVLPLASAAFFYLVLFASSAFLSTTGSVQFFRQPPKVMAAFLGGTADFLRPQGWLAVTMTHPVVLALLTAAALTVSVGAVATEIERGSMDLVLARPVGRRPLLVANAGAAVVAVTLTEAGGLAGTLLARATVDQMRTLTLTSVWRPFPMSWALFVAIAMIALLVSASVSLRGRAIGITVGIVVGWFFMNFIALLIDGLGPMRYASAFHYFRPSEVIGGASVVADMGVLLAIAAAALGAAVAVFARRDLVR